MAHRVGGEVDAYCTKCRMLLGHTIVAMVVERIVRVRCNTCMGQHAYRAGPPGSARPKTSPAPTAGAVRRTAAKPSSAALPVDEFLEQNPGAERKTYSPKERFEAGQVVMHPTFGPGIVQQSRQDKIDVVFRVGEKTLIHGKG